MQSVAQTPGFLKGEAKVVMGVHIMRLPPKALVVRVDCTMGITPPAERIAQALVTAR